MDVGFWLALGIGFGLGQGWHLARPRRRAAPRGRLRLDGTCVPAALQRQPSRAALRRLRARDRRLAHRGTED